MHGHLSKSHLAVANQLHFVLMYASRIGLQEGQPRGTAWEAAPLRTQ